MTCTRVRVFFFFSSRRRHTRCSRDWSSDVCSSDLFLGIAGGLGWSRAEGRGTVIGRAAGRTDERAQRHVLYAMIEEKGKGNRRRQSQYAAEEQCAGAEGLVGQNQKEIGRASCRERV